jgi:hypothetical protein
MAMTGSTVPTGWHYSAQRGGYDGPNGEFIPMHVVHIHGSLNAAIIAQIQKQNMAITPGSITHMGMGQVSVSNAAYAPKNLVLTTSFGDVTLDLEKGYITIPPGIGKDDAIREFWLAFQEHFQPTNKAEYEKKIKDLENKAEEYGKYATELVTNKIAKKIATKYGSEKFIMIKPEDLIRFIEE